MSLTFFHVIMKPIPSPLLTEIGLNESFVSFSLKKKENNVSNIFYVKKPVYPKLPLTKWIFMKVLFRFPKRKQEC